jgi:hypothetical protein
MGGFAFDVLAAAAARVESSQGGLIAVKSLMLARCVDKVEWNRQTDAAIAGDARELSDDPKRLR